MINAGPAPGLVPSGLPAAAIPTTAKIPEPIIAPTPKMIKSQTPKVFSKPPLAAFAIASSRFLRVTILVSKFFSAIYVLSSIFPSPLEGEGVAVCEAAPSITDTGEGSR